MYNAANYISRLVSVRVKRLADVVLLGLKKIQVSSVKNVMLYWRGGSYQAVKRMKHVESNHRLVSHEASHLPTVM